jgi:nicotinamide-nucleotide amidase
MSDQRFAGIVTIGSELVEGLRVDTNTAEVAHDLARFGFRVAEAVSVGDDEVLLAAVLKRLTCAYEMVVVTGGLGPTHDDVTRDATAQALGLSMHNDPAIVEFLQPFLSRHKDPASAEQVLTQAMVLDGAQVLMPTNGTAPGQIVPTPAGRIVLLPGPPSEMRPMLKRALSGFSASRAEPRDLGVTGMPESDVQHAAQRALRGREGIELTVLAKPGDVRVILLDTGAGENGLSAAARAVAEELGEACYATDGASLAQTLVRLATERTVTLAVAESCTGGMVSAAITDVPGASAVFLGGAVTYANEAKMELLDVPPGLLAQYGAVSEEAAGAMAFGARERFGADVCVSVTGIAGPDGGSADKPVGLVWFGVESRVGGAHAIRTHFVFAGAGRQAIRARATATVLDLIRREVLRA